MTKIKNDKREYKHNLAKINFFSLTLLTLAEG